MGRLEDGSYFEDFGVIYGYNQEKAVIDCKGQICIIIESEDDEGEVTTEHLPAKYEVCEVCNGKGTHVNPSIDSHGISSEEFYEDPDFEHSYFSGVYDVICYTCKGMRIVAMVDERVCKVQCPELLKRYREDQRQRARDAYVEAQERRMGA